MIAACACPYDWVRVLVISMMAVLAGMLFTMYVLNFHDRKGMGLGGVSAIAFIGAAMVEEVQRLGRPDVSWRLVVYAVGAGAGLLALYLNIRDTYRGKGGPDGIERRRHP